MAVSAIACSVARQHEVDRSLSARLGGATATETRPACGAVEGGDELGALPHPRHHLITSNPDQQGQAAEKNSTSS